jgi:hypothetical protein
VIIKSRKVRARAARGTLVFGLCAAAWLAPAHAQSTRQADRVSFYFAAHEDDWQLFMNPSAFADVADTKTRTVFVHVTAGDAGHGLGTRGRKHPYYMARENGADIAIRFMADAGEQPVEKVTSRVMLNGHPVTRVSYRSTVTYFLRLPDGHPRGIGFAGTGHQSLARLAKGEIGAMTTIDNATAYKGWTDLVTTMRALVDYERAEARTVQLNVTESDAKINPGDHSDHLMTAKLVLDAAADLACARRVHYVNYASSAMPENLAGQQRDMESSVVAATAAGLLALDHASIWHPYHRTYLGRNYFRVEEGTGDCRVPVAAALQVSVKPGQPPGNQ